MAVSIHSTDTSGLRYAHGAAKLSFLRQEHMANPVTRVAQQKPSQLRKTSQRSDKQRPGTFVPLSLTYVSIHCAKARTRSLWTDALGTSSLTSCSPKARPVVQARCGNGSLPLKPFRTSPVQVDHLLLKLLVNKPLGSSSNCRFLRCTELWTAAEIVDKWAEVKGLYARTATRGVGDGWRLAR